MQRVILLLLVCVLVVSRKAKHSAVSREDIFSLKQGSPFFSENPFMASDKGSLSGGSLSRLLHHIKAQASQSRGALRLLKREAKAYHQSLGKDTRDTIHHARGIIRELADEQHRNERLFREKVEQGIVDRILHRILARKATKTVKPSQSSSEVHLTIQVESPAPSTVTVTRDKANSVADSAWT